MTTAEQLLASMTETDKTFVIDNDLRTINIPASIKNLGVESDDDVLTVQFQMPGTYCGIDLSKFNIRINYLNAAGEGDYHDVDDAAVQSDGTIRFSWTIGRHAASVVGNVEFNVCMKKTDSSGNVLKEFNTTPASLPILKGLEVSEQVISEYNDILEQWRAKLFGIGDTEEARLLAVSQEQQQVISTKSTEVLSNIELKGQETLATIPDTYTEVYNMAEEAMRTKADAIVLEAEGSVITVSDASDDYLQNLKLYGKTKQVTTTGKNLWNPEAQDNVMGGTVRCAVTVKPNTVYTFGISRNTVSGLYASVNADMTDSFAANYGKKSLTFTTADVSHIYLQAYSDNSSFTESDTFYFNEGESLIEEPYSVGKASPSPDYPQDLTSIENTTVTIMGKNLLNHQGTSKTMNGITFTVNEDKSIHVNGTATGSTSYYLRNPFTLPKGSYVLSGCPTGGSVGTYRVYYSDNITKTVGDYGQPAKFTLDNSFTGMVVLQIYSGAVIDNLTFYPMIRNASFEDETYEPYIEPQAITLNHTLPGIPVTSGGNYTDENGQQWICDEVDFDRGVYVQRCFGFNTTFDYQVDLNRYTATLPHPASTEFAVENGIMLLCDKFTFNHLAGTGTPKVNGIRIATTSPNKVIAYYNGEVIDTAYLIYPLATPIETPLTAEEIAAFKALKTNYPNTTVLNDSDAHMSLAYSADTLLFLRDHQKPPTDEQVTNAVNAYLNEHGVQIPSDEYITNLMNGVITDAIGGSY